MPRETTNDVEGTSVRETIAQIRFAISQLSARNGHHDFEEMTRLLARETVCRNILPATGPVSAGGDQGRDFETFRTYSAGQVLPTGTEIGVGEGEGLAFACTLQADELGPKILSDTRKIMDQGTPVDHVVYYCESNIPIGRRHDLQTRALNEHAVHLEIFDGAAISELLSQRRLYWIAQEFLHLPAVALPPIAERPDWYDDDLRRWREEEHVPTTPGDLVDLTGCLRYATVHQESIVDLPFWVDRITALVHDGIHKTIQQRARYEIAVANLRGLGDLRPVDDLVQTYMAAAPVAEDPAELNDASVLLMYCIGARGRGLTNHSPEALLGWNRDLQDRIVFLLTQTRQPGRRCSLLETLGWLRSQPDLVSARESGVEYRLDRQIPRLPLDEIEEIARAGLLTPIDVPVVDLSKAFDAWIEMAELLPRAPLFPVERLGQMLRICAHILIEDRRYDAVVTALDSRIAEVVGGDAAASNARDRAMNFYGNGRLLDALREIHRARMGWFSGEMNEGMVLATLMTSQIYRDLGLNLAAKFAAMAAARLVDADSKELYARACFKAAEADYHQAAWFSSLEMADLGLRSHLLLAEDPHNWEKHGHLQYAFFEFSIVRGLATAAGVTYASFVGDVLERTGSGVLLDELLSGLEGVPWWETIPLEELTERVAEELGHPSFSDGGAQRTISWRALGVTWAVVFENDYDNTIVAERLAAVAQILLAEIAAADPALVPTNVIFEAEAIPVSEAIAIDSESNGRGTRWKVGLPLSGPQSEDAFRKLGQETLSVVLAAIADVSVLPQDEIAAMLEMLIKGGLLDKLSFGATYDRAYHDLLPATAFDGVTRRSCPPLTPSLPRIPHQAADLIPQGSGPHYNHNGSVEAASRRYTNITATLVTTLPALRLYAPFVDVIARLRGAGWKDWHILLAVLHVAQNNRLHVSKPPRNEVEAKELFRLFTTPEEPGDPAPLHIFTEEALRDAIRFSWLSTLKVFGLDLNQNPPDIDALEHLLASRYGYWTDDAPHDDPFPVT